MPILKASAWHSVYDYSQTASNRLDEITGTDAKNFVYDANGNTQVKGNQIFGYDDTNRMRTATIGTSTTSYGYNGKGERVRKTGSSTTLYHYDNSGNLLFESDANGNTLVEYIWLGNQRIAMVDDVPTNGGTLYYTHVDHLGTPQLLTDSSGQIVWEAEYDPFGEADVSGSVTYNLRFPGQYYDQETGLHYNYFRDYDPGLGRYLKGDPAGQFGDLNVYSYAYNNTIRYMDQYGDLPIVPFVDGVVSIGCEALKVYVGKEREKALTAISEHIKGMRLLYKQVREQHIDLCVNRWNKCLPEHCGPDSVKCQNEFIDCQNDAWDTFKKRIHELIKEEDSRKRAVDEAWPWPESILCPPINPKVS